MGTQNKEIKIALDIQAKIDKASSQIGALKKQIDNFELSKGLASDFAKEFKNIEHELAELQRKTASGEINLIDAKSAEKEIDKIEKRWAFLLNKIGGDGFLEKGLKTDAQAMSALESLAKSYANEIKEAEAQEARLNKKFDEAKQKQKELAEIQKDQKVVKASELEDQKAQLALLKQEEKTAKKARDDAEKALRAKVEESGGKYSMEQASQKGSPLRKTDAYRTFRDASAAYETAKANTRAQQANVGSMVTKEMQVAEATAAKEAIDKATEALDNYRKTSLATAKEDAFEKAKESLKSIAEFKDIDWEGLDIDMSEIKSVEDLEEALAKLRVEAEKRANDAIKEMETSTKDAGQGFKGLEEDIKNAKEGLEGMDEQARQTEAFEARIKQFLGMAGAVELLRRALRQAFETTKELDAAMTEMAVVTDLEVGDYWDQLPEHTKRASQLGVAIKDVYEAETLYYQQGLKTAEAQELANTTLRMARIAGLDAAEATDKMTAALRGFNMELNEASAEKVADVYSELAAITAADVNEISSAMTKTASIAASAGMEFETTAAFLSQIIETTRESAETAGTAMKTVIARFSEVKKLQGEGLTTGSDEEGEVIDVNKIQTALRTVGISMDEFFAGTEGLDSIFMKLAEKWDTLDVKTQRYIATTAAGSRQQSRFIAMMSDYARTQELVTAANNSAGASQEQYQKTLESLESKLAQLKNAWNEFSMGILESDLVKFGVDALKTFLEIINKATSAFDGLGGSISKVLTTIALFKLGQKIFDGIKKPMANFFTKLVKDVYTEGQKAGQAFAQGLEDSKKTEEQKKEEAQRAEQEKHKEYLDVKQPKTVVDKIGEATGISNFGKQKLINEKEEYDFKKFKTMQKEGGKKKYEQDYLNAKKRFDNVDARQKNGEIIDQKEVDEATQSLIDAEDALVHYKKTEEKVHEASQKGWENVGQGISKMGAAITGAGVGISMLGGMISQLGLEELGEAMSWVGGIVTFVGGAFSILGMVLPFVGKEGFKAGVKLQAGFWPFLIILGSIIVLIGIIAAILAVVKSSKANSLAGRMEAAAKATEAAREQAEQAKQAYDDMVADRKGFDEMQDKLKNLTKGTKEWKEALRESNAQALDLVQTYPELAKYITRGDQGQLTIADEGWDAMIEAQEKSVANAQAVLMNKQLAEIDLKEEKLNKDMTKYLEKTSGGNTTKKEAKDIWSQLDDYNNMDASNIEDREKAIREISDKWNMTEEEAKIAAAECERVNTELRAAAEEAESIAQATLTTLASENVTNSEFGEQTIDAFANSMGNQVMQDKVDQQVKDMKEESDYSGTEEFDRLSEEYGVKGDMTGNDTHDLKTLYKAVLGVEEIPEEIADDREAMLKAIAQADQTNQMKEAMDRYTDELEAIAQRDEGEAKNIAALLSDDGKNLSRDFANQFMTGANGSGEFNRAMVDEVAENFGGIDAWAEKVGKTTEELYKEIEENVKNAITVNTSTFGKLNKALGAANKKINGANAEINKFGEKVVISTEQNKNLAEKLINASQVVGDEAALNLKSSIDSLLDGARGDAEKVAQLIGTTNWNSLTDLEQMIDVAENMGLDPTIITNLESLKQQIIDLGIAVETVDLKTITSSIQSMYDLMKSIASGEQSRDFDEDAYNAVIAADESLKSSFVQLGDKFYYLGNSLDELNTTLKEGAAKQAALAKLQLEQQVDISNAAKGFLSGDITDYEGKKIDPTKSGDFTEAQQIAFLDSFRVSAIQSGVESLKFLTDENGDSLNLTLGTNFDELDENTRKSAINAILRMADENEELKGELTKSVTDANVAQYVLRSSGELLSLMGKDQNGQTSVKDTDLDQYAKAFSIQAVESGMVSEAVISEYNGLIEKNFDEMSGVDKKRMLDLENIMKKGIDQASKNSEAQKKVNEMTNRVAEALYNSRQKEIDELSMIYDSVNSANDKIVSKLQEQIDEDRAQRQKEEQEKALSDNMSKLAYLLADTSGASDLAAMELQREIQDQQQDYQDMLIDQAIQKLSDDNAAAAEQRQEQISLMQAQLDHDRDSGNLARQAEQIAQISLDQINAGVDPLSTELGKILTQEISGDLSKSEKESLEAAIWGDARTAANAYSALNNTASKLGEGTESYVKEIKEQIAKEKSGVREDAIQDVKSGIVSGAVSTRNGFSGIQNSQQYKSARARYEAAGGNATDFDTQIQKYYKEELKNNNELSGSIDEVKVVKKNNLEKVNLNGGIPTTGDMKVEMDGKKYTISARYATGEGSGIKHEDVKSTSQMAAMTGLSPQSGWIAAQGGKLYIYSSSVDSWLPIQHDADGFVDAYKEKLTSFQTGGLADFTGPAWLDGTKSNPELILNARDTANFLQLKDILSEIMNGTTSIKNDSKATNGDNYFTIDINVEELKDDYDVEQLANKIRSMLYEDASYRNVNAVSFIR